jgi:predicted ATPase/GAF domain-containing protein/tRNA A-37 threonylcarbamoyl transferase component Bud32/HPt (histidine-containing phosphotransfer) domain-containing protein
MFLDGYAIHELIAQSERNSVRRARRLRDGARVIIKTPTTEYPTARDVRRLEFEHHVLTKLRSPGVIEVVALERRAGRLALVLEDFGGERLPIAPGHGLPLEHFYQLARGIVRALGEVHANGVIHKDVNPNNVLMNPATGTVKLIDFSLASELMREHADAVPCKDLEGTLPYLSPEQTGRMNRDVDYRTDYYSLGVTFYELLTGALPFSAPDILGYVHCHLSKQPPSVRERASSVPEMLARIVAKLMAKNPDERYQSASGLLHDLARCEESWNKTGDVPVFELGTRDVSERFQVSQALVGRQAEVTRLLAAFERTSNGPAELLLVSGYSGVGKSSLVRELYKPIVEKRAKFVSGKFEQLERNTPYGAIVQAVRSLLKQALTGSEEQLLAERRRLETALGSEANVLVPLLPELGRIMGPQPPVAELPAREAQARLHRVFRAFLRAVATRHEPLVIFVDDLQWTDGSTPQLLVQLLTEGEIRHLLVIGAYRDNEVGESHLLQAALREIERKRPDVLHEVRLAPLDAEALERIVAATLHTDREGSRPLAELLFEKTGGNPFFTNELLYRLHRQEAIRFDPASGSFRYDAASLANVSFSENVVELMIERLKELPPETLELVKLAACLGNEFELALLARVAKKPRQSVASALWRAVERQLLSPKGDDYRLLRAESADEGSELGALLRYEFPHDRVMQAAYSLLEPAERARAHLAIGRFVRDAVPPEEHAARVFEFVDHYNLGRSLLVSFEEREELSTFNLVAAQRARRSAAYATAVGYVETSEDLLSAREWAAQASRRFECSRMRVECLFLSGQVERASELCEELFARAPDRVAKASVYTLKAQIQEQQSRLADSVATIVGGLRELGLELPADPEAIGKGIGEGIGKLLAHLERVPIEELERLPVLGDSERIAQTELLFQLIPPASQMNPPLFILAELILFDLALTHGTVAGSAKNFMDCGIVLGAILKDYPRAYRMGKVAFAMLERQIPTPLESAVNFVFGCFISHWGAHFQEGLDALARGHRRGVELGDTLHASYSIVHHAKSSFFAGKELAECKNATELAFAYTRATGAVGHEAVPRMLRRALGLLQATDLTDTDILMSDAEFTQEIEKTGNDHFLFVLGQIQTLVHLVLGDWEAAEAQNRAVEARIAVGNGSFPVPDYYLFAGLLLCRRARSASEDERAALVLRIEAHVAELTTFAGVCAPNFAHKQKLLLAELARVKHAPMDEVLELYADALTTAGDDFLHVRALCYELQAEFWTEKEQPQLARECLLESYHLYRHWGARAKLTRLEQTNRAWLERANLPRSAARGIVLDTMVTATVTTGVESSSLDVASAIKATHAISSEVKAERLFAVLVQAIIENAGAEHGYLIVKADDSDDFSIAARASVTEDTSSQELPVPLDRFEPIAHELVRYVGRTHETIVLDDAREDELYKNDPHVVREAVQSVLCMPILNQGVLQAILYVENNAVSRAFTPARVSLLRVIAGQAAISIANAHLYNHLEQKVDERTRELAERNREVAAMLNSLEQGVFTVDERLVIEPRYSAHLERLLGTRELAGRDCLELLFAGAGLEKSALDNMRAALEFSFGASPVFAEANRSHWVREFQRKVAGSDEQRSFEVDWTLIADANDSVCKILVAVRDVTLVKALSAKAAEHARELDIVGQVLDATVEQFQRLSTSARRVLAHARELLEREVPSDAVRSELFRHLHTLKGNARMLGLGYLAQAVHAAEEPFAARDGVEDAEARRRERLAGIDAVRESLDEYERACRQKLGDVLEPAKRETDDVSRAIARQLELVKAGSLDSDAALAAIERLLERAGSVALAGVVKSSARVLPALADETGKVAPKVELDEPEIMLPANVAGPLGDALIHVFTNALDHGLESAEERVRRGKSAQGTIRVSAVRSPMATSISVRDDGRGLAIDALRSRGAATDSDEIAAERIFASGVSTAAGVTASSGRGVGLDAVRAALRSLGGDARAVFTGPREGGYRPFELVLELPAEEPPAARAAAVRLGDLTPWPTRVPDTARRSWPPPGAS